MKRFAELRPWVDIAGRSSFIHGAMSDVGASVDGGGFEGEGTGRLAVLDGKCLLFSFSGRLPLIASNDAKSSGESENKAPLAAWMAEFLAALYSRWKSVSFRFLPDLAYCYCARASRHSEHLRRRSSVFPRYTHRSSWRVRRGGCDFFELASETPIILSCSRMVPFFAGFSETCFVAVLPPLVIVGPQSFYEAEGGQELAYQAQERCI